MGEYQTKEPAARAQPKQQQHPTRPLRDSEARIAKVEIVDGQTRILIAKGASHNVRVGVEGYVKAPSGPVAAFRIVEVRSTTSVAVIDVDPQELAGLRHVILAPSRSPTIVARTKRDDNAGNTWKLAAPDRIDLGDNVVDRRTRHETSIFAIGRAQGPRIRASVEGDPAVALARTPLFLPGTGGTFDASRSFVLEHKPTKAGEIASTLRIEILDAPNETFRYPVIAAAHDPGMPTNAEQRSARKEQQQREHDEANDRADRARLEHQVAQQNKRDTKYHSGNLRELEGIRAAKVIPALEGLYAARRAGVDSAREEVGDFVREKRIVKPSLLEQLAVLALEVATAGIAGALARHLDTALSKAFSTGVPNFLPTDPRNPRRETVSNPSRAIVALFTDGLKEGVKKGAKLRVSGPASGTGASRSGGAVVHMPDGDTYLRDSTDPEVAFFGAQTDQLVHDELERKGPLAMLAQESLLPTLQIAPELAFAAFEAVANGIQKELDDARAKQLEQSVRKWVRYLAESESRSLNARFDEDTPLRAVDGVIDLTIGIDYRHPERPVEVIGARLHGVKAAVKNRMALQPLINLGVPVRATGSFDSPSATLTVVRQADGGVEFTENTSVQPGARASWLERKALAHGRGADAAAGARALLEREIMPHALYSLVKEVRNDSDEK